MSGKVHVIDEQGNPVAGAFVTVNATGWVFPGTGYNATETTDVNGNAMFANPNGFTLVGAGSSADVIVNWTDPSSGTKYAGEGNWSVSGGSLGLIGLTNTWSPSTLNIQLDYPGLSIQTPKAPDYSAGGIAAWVSSGLGGNLGPTIEIIGIAFVVAIAVGGVVWVYSKVGLNQGTFQQVASTNK